MIQGWWQGIYTFEYLVEFLLFMLARQFVIAPNAEKPSQVFSKCTFTDFMLTVRTYAADRRPESKSVVRPCAASSRSAALSTATLASGRSSAGMIVMVLR